MDYSFFDFMTLIGSLGLFLYGMKLMSEALQKVAGNKLRTILTAMTRNRFMGVLTGLLITALIQSSSATTVMVVSFVNAGLLSLVQSITVIMGANIGTTVTAWIISLFGFKVSIAAFAVPLIAVSIPFIFSSKGKHKSWGEFIMGFALLFIGLEMLKNAVPDLQSNPDMLAFLSRWTDMGFGSVIVFLLIGTLLTVVVQSSSATMAITLVMCSKGWIPFDLAAAMVLGENIGTTITANLAAIPANVSAKRAALSHLVFNVFGVIWMLCVFYPFIRLMGYLVGTIGPGDPTQLTAFAHNLPPDTLQLISDPNATLTAEQAALREQLLGYQVATTYALSLFHTMFNLVNTTVMIGFVGLIAKCVSAIVKQKDQAEDVEFQLKYISIGMLSTSELSILQAWKEIKVYGDRTYKMFGLVRDLYHEKNGNEFTKKFSRIEKYENISDRMEVEIASYLNAVADGRLSEPTKQELRSMLRVISEIESVNDSCYNIARIIQRQRNENLTYIPEVDNNIELMFNLLEGAIYHMDQSLEGNHITDDVFNRSQNLEAEINNFRNQLKRQNIVNVNEKKYPYQTSVVYMDTIVECEKLGDYVINVMEALHEATY